MKPGVRGKRGKQKILSLSKQQVGSIRSPYRYIAVDRFITNFETTYYNVHGRKIEVVYRKGYYYFDNVRWDHDRLEREFVKLLLRELNNRNQIGEIHVRPNESAEIETGS